MNLDPGREVFRVGGFITELGKVEPRGGRGGVMARGAVLLKECIAAGEWKTRGRGASA